MNKTIRQFYENNNIPKPIIEKKIAAFNRHNDISEEFETWITNKTYKTYDAVCVEGYTAKVLSEMSEYLNGEGAFSLLIELRENPEKALSRIKKGFRYK